jgi:hypothetical protein
MREMHSYLVSDRVPVEKQLGQVQEQIYEFYAGIPIVLFAYRYLQIGFLRIQLQQKVLRLPGTVHVR